MKPPRDLEQDMALLGITRDDIRRLLKEHIPDFDAATAAFKAMVRAKRKEKQREAHPDRGGSLELSQEINAAADAMIAGVKIGPVPRPKPVVFVVGFGGGVQSSTTTTWTSSTTGGWDRW